MADLFRVLMRDNRELAPLADEVELCRQYLALEKLRLGERLQVEWHLKSMPGDALVPPLVLQPLLENAVYHGIEPSSAPGVRVDQHLRQGRRRPRDPAQSVPGERRPPPRRQQDGDRQRPRAARAALRRRGEPRVARRRERLRGPHPHALPRRRFGGGGAARRRRGRRNGKPARRQRAAAGVGSDGRRARRLRRGRWKVSHG